MADQQRRALRDLIRELTSGDQPVEFFQLARLLGQLRTLLDDSHNSQDADRQDREGHVRYRAAIRGAFLPASTVPRNGRPDADVPDEIVTTFMALAGSQGVLPPHYTALILERLRDGDTTLRDYLDVFHHRLMTLLVRGWEKYRPYVDYERAANDRSAGDDPASRSADPFTKCLRRLVGLGSHSRPHGFDENILLYYSAIFGNHRRPAIALQNVLADILDCTVEIQQFFPRKTRLLPEHRWRLTSSPEGALRLGQGVLLGESVPVTQTSFLIRIGPLSLERFREHLPGGSQFEPLNRLVRHFVGFEFVFEVRPMLAPDEVPGFRLSGEEAMGTRLGWESWLGNERMREHPVDDVRFVIRT
ncbi:MAG: type VI secretion system baseplate subunit TssG [Maioricimonas sp. JB045]|uniref:type VI secretion system baseplate subunit TssG n=1 Tax=Maioricimonas sp. JC845 TaxID=3232138 RepID=UPI00345950E3